MYRSVKYLLAWLLLALPLVGLVAQPAVGNSVTDLKKLLGIGAPEDSFLNEDDAFAVQAIPPPGVMRSGSSLRLQRGTISIAVKWASP